MAAAQTEKYEEMILDVELVSGSGIYTPICGMTDVTISRTATIDSTEIPDCDDESLPLSVEKQVRSIDVSISATGVWAKTSQDMLKAWFYSAAVKNVRIRDTAAASGDIEIESGPALLASLKNSRTKGKKVTADVELQLDGTPARTDKP
ncbi:phage tail protein [Mesorhizobium sp. M0830]|uniref:phage tail tube protein n=1 Tax=Mesorhizobium sp. M0830 TaxID=2957008 RepID=UPI00333B35D8